MPRVNPIYTSNGIIPQGTSRVATRLVIFCSRLEDWDRAIIQNNIMRHNEVRLKIAESYQVIARFNTIYENPHAQFINGWSSFANSTPQRA